MDSEPSAFRLRVGGEGLATLTFDHPHPRVNLFDPGSLGDLEAVLGTLREAGGSDPEAVRCLVLLSAKEDSFCHGADTTVLQGLDTAETAAEGARWGQRLLREWAALPFPTVAAIDGTCVGGGLELATASTFRLVSDRRSIRLGLPEVKLGLLPAWGGCVRLPRLLGISEALKLIAGGHPVSAAKAKRLGLVDEVFPAADFLRHVRRFATAQLGRSRRPGHEGDLKELLLERNPLGRKILFDQARKRTLERTGGRYPAPLRAVEVVRLGLEEGPEAGFTAEVRAFGELAAGREARALLHVHTLTQAAKRPSAAGPPPPLERAAVLGAGTMGAPLALLLAERLAIPVRLLDRDAATLGRAFDAAAERLSNKVKRRRRTEPEAQRTLTLLQPGLDPATLAGLGRRSLLLEALPEDLEIKREALAEACRHLPPEVPLATLTSSLSVAAVAEGLPEPRRLVGLHFLNPLPRLSLVEVVAAPQSSPEALAAAAALVRSLGKTPLAVKDSPGFLLNRLITVAAVEALRLLREGASVEQIDGAMTTWGWAEGPLAVCDRVGLPQALDIAASLAGSLGPRLRLPPLPWREALVEPGRTGLAAGHGLYLYQDGRRREPDPKLYRRLGLDEPRPAGAGRSDECLHRLLVPMIDEAARCLEEELVPSPAQVDLAVLLGAGFPAFRGGLCRWADETGLEEILRVAEGLSSQVSERFEPSEALHRVAARGGFYGP